MKIFCIGRNKTGTTSLFHEFERLGYSVGRQKPAAELLREYTSNNFKPIVNYCETAEFFQDFPFSYPHTFKHLDEAYPNSKFILTIRNSPEEWYDSVVRFHSNIFGNGKIPTANQLKNSKFIWKGWVWEAHKAIYNIDESNPYDKDELIRTYNEHNDSVIEYFKNRKDLLILNLAEDGSYQKFLNFLKIESPYSSFLHKNSSQKLSKGKINYKFIKIPKTASTFFENNFHNKVGKVDGVDFRIESVGHSWLYPTQIKGWRDWDFPQQTKGEYRDVMQFGFDINNDVIVTIVRNPFELLFSYFNYNWAWCRNYHNLPEFQYSAKDFQKFVDIYLDDTIPFHAPAFKKSLFSQLKNKEGNWILQENSIIIRFETLKKDIESFSKFVNIPITDYSDNAKNKAADKPCNWWEAYTSEQIIKLNELWKEDLDYFGYTFK